MQRGDIVACTSHGLLGAAIRFAERRDHEEHADINHIATLNERVGDDWTVYQAVAHGITDDALLSTVTPGGRHFVIPFPEGDASVDDYLDFIEAHVGAKYGWLTNLSDAGNMLLPDSICVRRANTFNCSGLAAAALQYAGYKPAICLPDVYSTTPASIISMLQGKGFPTVTPK